jgi:hypothetical protein
MNDDLQKRFPKQKREWGVKKAMFSVLFRDHTLVQRVEKRATDIGTQLGYKVTRSEVIEDSVRRDPEIKR